MMCPICGAESRELARQLKPFMTTLVRTCTNNHRFNTYEVHSTQLADAREMNSAISNIKRRVERFQRDRSIARDGRSNKEVAQAYGLTESRVRQIRASIQDFPSKQNGGIIGAQT